MEKKKLSEKFYDAPLLVHFFVYMIATTLLVFLMFKTLNCLASPPENELRFKVQLAMAITIGFFIGLMGVAANWNGRKNDKYFAKMAEFRKKTREAKTAMELHELKNEITLFYQNNSCTHPHAQTLARDIFTMMETRMEFEFKIPQ
jgi:hypothetical protein